MAASTKKLKAYKVGNWKFPQLKFSIIFGRDDMINEEEGQRWHKRIYFQPLPPPIPHHPIDLPQQGQTQLSFRTDYIGKVVGKSQFARQGRMVYVGVPQGY